jgi:hypothetical protein
LVSRINETSVIQVHGEVEKERDLGRMVGNYQQYFLI